MKESELMGITGLGKCNIVGYRGSCGAKGGIWGEEALMKLEAQLGLPAGSLKVKKENVEEEEEELVISRIYPYRRDMLGVRKKGDRDEIRRCWNGDGGILRLKRVPVQKKFKIGYLVRARWLRDDLWVYVGIVKGQ